MEELEIIKASEVETREIEWLWYPFIPYGKVTVLQGDAGDGKSLMILKLAAMLTRGEPLPFTEGQSGDGSLIDEDGSTWYTAREVMTNAEESTDTCGEWNLSCHAPGNQLPANL